MTHPDELLAAYVDGSLAQDERAEVDEHLGTCSTCREEIALAARAVAVLAELPEEPVPFGVMNPVTAEIGRRRAGRLRRHWTVRVQWAAGFAAAAAVIAIAAVALPQLGRQGLRSEGVSASSSNAPREGAAKGLAGTVPLEVQASADYGSAKLERLAVDTAARPAPAEYSAQPPKKATVLSGSPAQAAAACLAQPGGVTTGDRLVRLIQAKFQDKPAYIGVYLEGRPANRIVIWVVSERYCSILSFSSNRL